MARRATVAVRAGGFMLAAVMLSACSSGSTDGGPAMSLQLTSSAFVANGDMPRQLTCEGGDRSPPLAWSVVPVDTKSFALIVDDPDAPDPAAPQRTWVHWVVYNLPADVAALEEGASTQLPTGARDGRNDWGRTGYGGPCPPVGRHRYFHKLYALDIELPAEPVLDKAGLERAMEGHVLARAELVGTYQKTGR
ncbi:YbhB/YbcL family Raf kinase inhibitor-like protein [Lysobacter solisilvae]|uniref:YbhB/YbcL family Raf kinase inhibitor-like protein n=2 Tax=Agrilutibacter solisilvae TaxID=2763317 RepID=A0A975AU78_9GAMM|nr:YbhB/YbcL family Raf kinase inhibitor-like protein [Lysobacter solisilvae]